MKARKWMELSKKCLKRAKEGSLGKTTFQAFKMKSVYREWLWEEFDNDVGTIPCKYCVLHTIKRKNEFS